MVNRELHAFTRRTIRGHYVSMLGAALLWAGSETGFRLVPCLLAWLLMNSGHMSSETLFLRGTPLWLAFTLLWMLLRFCVMTPVRCAGASYITVRLGLADDNAAKVFFPDTLSYIRGLYFFACMSVCRFLTLLPCMAGFSGAHLCFSAGAAEADSGVLLFAAAQCLCLGIAGAVHYCKYCIETAAVPFLYLAEPQISPFTAISRSRHMLDGHRAELLVLVLGYVPLALPVVTIPFLLPYMMTNYVLFLQIRMREWAQTEEESHNAGTEISHGAFRGVYARGVSAS